MIRVFASGQSNMTGRDRGGPDWSSIDNRVRVWNNVNPLGANGSAFVTAAAARASGTFQDLDKNNLGVWFCHRVAQIRDDNVNMTMVSRGGAFISEWAPGSAIPLLQECIDVYAATGQPPADVFIWMQGEGDATAISHAAYKTAFLNLVANLKAAGVIATNAAIIIGEVFPGSTAKADFNVGAIRALAAENSDIFFAEVAGLSVYDVTTHFDGPSLYTYGADRFFAAYAKSQGIEMADLFALVNEGGVPGTPNSGENKIYDLTALASLGLLKKDVTESPDFTGTLPVDKIMTAGMLAAGAVVEYGTDGANGTYFRFESGLQVCFIKGIATYASTSQLKLTWNFPKPFIAPPFVIPSMTGAVNAGLAADKRSGTYLNVEAITESLATTALVRLTTQPVFATTDTFGLTMVALGFWK